LKDRRRDSWIDGRMEGRRVREDRKEGERWKKGMNEFRSVFCSPSRRFCLVSLMPEDVMDFLFAAPCLTRSTGTL